MAQQVERALDDGQPRPSPCCGHAPGCPHLEELVEDMRQLGRRDADAGVPIPAARWRRAGAGTRPAPCRARCSGWRWTPGWPTPAPTARRRCARRGARHHRQPKPFVLGLGRGSPPPVQQLGQGMVAQHRRDAGIKPGRCRAGQRTTPPWPRWKTGCGPPAADLRRDLLPAAQHPSPAG